MGIRLQQMIPSLLIHLVAVLILSVPAVILGETTLSFLGLGIRPPAVSWGMQLQEAQNLRAVALAPWVLIPGIAVVITSMAFSFLGDWLRRVARSHIRIR
jgi:peptide/nickel transport system permease protein